MGEAQPKLEPTVEELEAIIHDLEMELGQQAADLIETQGELTWVKQRQEKRVGELRTVYKAARLVLSTTDFDELARVVAHGASVGCAGDDHRARAGPSSPV